MQLDPASAIGIDLSGGSRATIGQTALAQVSLEDPPRQLDSVLLAKAASDALILDWVGAHTPQVVAIDAPLTLPHSVTCEVPQCPRCEPGRAAYVWRDVDRKAGGMSMVMIAAICFRGMYLARRLRADGYEVIEVYPAAAYRALGISTPEERRIPARVTEVLQARVEGLLAATADERDALCAALVAADYANGRAEAIAGLDGMIWLPGPGG